MDSLYSKIFTRNYGVIDTQEQLKLKNSHVTVVGAGGVGGITLLNLARLGVGHIHVIDADKFDYSNINRQMLSSVSRVGQYKARCAEESLLDINPDLQIKVTIEFVNEHNVTDLLKESDVIVDATDNLISRTIIHTNAQKLKIPSIWIAVTPPFRGGVMSFNETCPPYTEVLKHPSIEHGLKDEVKNKITQIKNERALHSVSHGALSDWAHSFVEKKAPWAVIAPVANIVGLMASFEAFKFILNRQNLVPILAPNLIKINLAQTDMMQVIRPPEGSWDNAFL